MRPGAAAEPFAGDLVAGFQSVFPTNAIVQAVARRPDGGLYAGGAFFGVGGLPRTNIVLLRADGTVDPAFDPGTGFDAQAFALALQGDGVLVGGSFGLYNGYTAFCLTRLLPNGQPDPVFRGHDLINLVGTSVQAIRIAPDGKIVVGGLFTRQNRIGRRNLARLQADGSVDTGFDAGDITDRQVHAIAVQADGRIIYGGSRLGRLLANGAADPSFFGGAGSTLEYDTVLDLQLDASGRVLCVGSFDVVGGTRLGGVVRLLPDGTRDPQFHVPEGSDGVIRKILVLADGSCLVGGEFTRIGGLRRRSVARLLSNGEVDRNFRADLAVTDIGTVLYATARSFVQAPDGNIFVGGIFRALNGKPISALAHISTGLTNIRPARALAGGDVLRVPESTDAVLTVRTDGSPIPAIRWLHGLQSVGTTNNDTLVLSNVTAAASGEYRVVVQNSFGTVTQLVNRLEITNLPAAAGQVQPAFYPGTGPGPRTAVTAPSFAYAAAPLTDGGVVVGGVFSNFNGLARTALVRLTPAGLPDSTFPAGGSGPAGATPASVPEIRQIARLTDGRLLVAGTHATFSGVARPGLTRLQADGTVDPDFQPAGFSTFNFVTRFLAAPGGGWYLAGQFTRTQAPLVSGLCRIGADGALDTTFTPLAGDANIAGAPGIQDFALLPDHRLVIGGFFTSIQGQPRNSLAVLHPNGLIDATFRPTNSLFLVRAVGAQADGRVLMGGTFEADALVPRRFLARFMPDGAFDPSFDASATIKRFVNRIIVLPDQRLLVAVGGIAGQGVADTGVFRLLPDGRNDPDFGDLGRTDNGVLGMALDPAGALWIAGGFTEVNGISRNGVALLRYEAGVAPPLQLGFRLAGNAAEVFFPSVSGRPYQLEYRDAVNGPGWTSGATGVGNGGELILRDQPRPPGQRFYRVRSDN